MSTAIDFPVDRARFPNRCVSCGVSSDTTVTVECTSGVDLVFIKFWRWHDFALPCCSTCKARRKRAGVVFSVLSLLAVFGVLIGMFSLAGFFTRWGQRDLWLGLTLGTFWFVLYLARNWPAPLLDASLLGVRGVRLTRTGIGTLQFRDREFAREAAVLSGVQID